MIALTYAVQVLGYAGIVLGLAMLVLSGPRREGPAYCPLKKPQKHRPLSAGDANTVDRKAPNLIRAAGDPGPGQPHARRRG